MEPLTKRPPWSTVCGTYLGVLDRVLVVVILLGSARTAAADDKPTLSGSWSATALSETWSVSDWGAACGPKPTGQGAGGGAVQIREQGGELSIVGAGRAFSTAECWEQMPGLARTSHSQSGGGRFWRTRCTSPANDPRRAAVTTSIQATDNSISLSETGEYQFILKDTTCRATVSRFRSFSLVRREGDPPPGAPTATSPPAPASLPSAEPASTVARPAASAPTPARTTACSGTPGDPARIEVHPARKVLRPGEQTTFSAVVLDSAGCPTGLKPQWSIAHGPLSSYVSIDARGALDVVTSAPEGTLEVTVGVSGKVAKALVEVVSPSRYDALLDVSQAGDGGDAPEAPFTPSSKGTIGGSTTTARDGTSQRRAAFVVIAGAVALSLAAFGLAFSRRAARSRGAAPARDSLAPGPEDDRQPEPADPPQSATSSIPGAAAGGERESRGKVCPTCGERYGAEAEFCGRDATKLFPLN